MKDELHAWTKKMQGMTTGSPRFFQMRLEELEQLLAQGAATFINEPDAKGIHVLTKVARAYKYDFYERYQQAEPIIMRLREAGAVWMNPVDTLYQRHYQRFQQMAWSRFQLH